MACYKMYTTSQKQCNDTPDDADFTEIIVQQ